MALFTCAADGLGATSYTYQPKFEPVCIFYFINYLLNSCKEYRPECVKYISLNGSIQVKLAESLYKCKLQNRQQANSPGASAAATPNSVEFSVLFTCEIYILYQVFAISVFIVFAIIKRERIIHVERECDCLQVHLRGESEVTHRVCKVNWVLLFPFSSSPMVLLGF